jgi:hypothetical protein
VKRGDLIRKVQRAAKDHGMAFSLLRTSGGHEVWSLDGIRVIIPRHKEINERTGQGIYRILDAKLGKDWWR